MFEDMKAGECPLVEVISVESKRRFFVTLSDVGREDAGGPSNERSLLVRREEMVEVAGSGLILM